jgi:hypothetical protein
VDLLRAHREAMKGSSGFGHAAFPSSGRVGAIGALRLQAFASASRLPLRKVRLLRWDMEIDLAAGVVCRAAKSP